MRQTMSRRQFVTTTALLGTGLLTCGAGAIAGEDHLSVSGAAGAARVRPDPAGAGKGYFKEAGFEVEFAVGRGGVDVAKQVGAGNAPLGGIVADGPIMVRATACR